MPKPDKGATPAELERIEWTRDAADAFLEVRFGSQYRHHALSDRIRDTLYVAGASYLAGLDPAWALQTPRQRGRDLERLDALLREAREIASKGDVLSALGISLLNLAVPTTLVGDRAKAQATACVEIEAIFDLLIKSCREAAQMNREFGKQYHKANQPTRALVYNLADIWEATTGKSPPIRDEGEFCDFVDRVCERLGIAPSDKGMGAHVKDLLRERAKGGIATSD